MERGEKFVRAMLAILCVCSGVVTCGAIEPNEQDIQLAGEKMQQLREVYKEVQQAEAHLVRITKEAEQKEPLLREMAKAVKKINQFKEHGLAKERTRYKNYLKNSTEPNRVREWFDDCRVPFAAKEWADALSDANQERLLKIPLIRQYRYPEMVEKLKRDLSKHPSFTFFDPNDPNDDRLWQNIKRFNFELAEHNHAKRRQLLDQEGVPEWLADYAGKYSFAQSAFETYTGGLALLTPMEVQESEKRLLSLYHKMSTIYPGWSQMRHLLAEKYTEEDKAVARAAREHIHLWPTVP